MKRPGWRQQLARGLSTAAIGALVVAADVPQQLALAGEEDSFEETGEDQARRRAGDVRTQLESWIAHSYPQAPNSTADQVGLMLRDIGPLERIDLVSSWARSPRVDLRHTLAMVLAHMAEEVGVPEAIEVLTKDHVASVRITAEEAATCHQRKRRS